MPSDFYLNNNLRYSAKISRPAHLGELANGVVQSCPEYQKLILYSPQVINVISRTHFFRIHDAERRTPGIGYCRHGTAH